MKVPATMTSERMLSRLLACLALLCAAAAHAGDNEPEVEQALAAAFPAQSIDSVERANAAREAVVDARAAVAHRFANEKSACYDRFFVSSCLIDVRNRERQANKVVRRVEVEANAFLRRERAAERDRAVAQREKRAAEQGAKSLSITGAAREGNEPTSDKPADAVPADNVERP